MNISGQSQNCSNSSTVTNIQNRINIVYTSMCVASLVISVPTTLLTGHQYFKKTTSVEYSEGIFLLYSFVLMLISFVESFQWVFQFTEHYSGFAGCVVLAACREYVLLTMLFLTACVGIHLGLLVRQPKWLMVIDEVKRKRHRTLLVVYVHVTFILPLLLVPWPFMTQGYGRNDYTCYIIPHQAYYMAGVIEQLLLWHVWAYLVWIIVMLVILLLLHTMSCHRPSSLTTNATTLLCIMAVFLLAILVNTAVFVMDAAITTAQDVYCDYLWLVYVEAICTPLQIMIASFVLMFRAYKRNRHTVTRKNVIINHHGHERVPFIGTKP